MIHRCFALALVVALAGGGAVQAEEADKVVRIEVEGSTDLEKCSKDQCPIEAAMKQLPHIAYLVGEEETHCPKSAESLAREHGVPIMFLVGEDQFDKESDAKVALVSATEKFIQEFATPCICEVSGVTSVAGQELHCSKSAAKLASLVTEAMNDVHFTYLVGDEECACPKHAESLAKATGEKKLFVVGDEKTACQTTAS